jgi:hypothetical protein
MVRLEADESRLGHCRWKEVMLMTPEEQLRAQRQALNAALNSRDLPTATSFLHPDFIAQGKCGPSMDSQTLLQHMQKVPRHIVSLLEVETVEVSGDRARLVVRRAERQLVDPDAIAYWPDAIWGITVGATGWIALERLLADPWSVNTAFSVGFFIFMVGIGLFLGFQGRRLSRREVRAQETWRRIDGRWLVIEVQEL